MAHRLWGDVETFQPHDTELVWTLGEGRHVYVELQPEGRTPDHESAEPAYDRVGQGTGRRAVVVEEQ